MEAATINGIALVKPTNPNTSVMAADLTFAYLLSFFRKIPNVKEINFLVCYLCEIIFSFQKGGNQLTYHRR